MDIRYLNTTFKEMFTAYRETLKREKKFLKVGSGEIGSTLKSTLVGDSIKNPS